MAPEIILYHYSFSPYAKRIIWYLTLRRIPYSQCVRPHHMPPFIPLESAFFSLCTPNPPSMQKRNPLLMWPIRSFNR